MEMYFGNHLWIIVFFVLRNYCVAVLNNVAVGKPAFQSSTEGQYVASLAVDGSKDGDLMVGSCSHTLGLGAADYWEVDLGDVYIIGYVFVYNRVDCCWERARNVQVYVGVDQKDYVLSGYLEGELGFIHVFQMESNTHGRWVRITRDSVFDALNLCEVEVFGEILNNLNPYSNVALGKPAFQTDIYEPFVASRAVDGFTYGDMYNDSCMHTKGNGPADYWEVDLEDVYRIDHVVLFNRLECCRERTRNVQVFVGFDQNDYVLSAYLDGLLGFSHTFQMDLHTYGRWVRITRDSVAEPLNFCEVEVYAELLSNVNNVRFELLSNRIGVDTILSTIPNSSQIFCAALCKASNNCVGFNFDTSSLECTTFRSTTSSDNIQGHLKLYGKG